LWGKFFEVTFALIESLVGSGHDTLHTFDMLGSSHSMLEELHFVGK